MFRPAVLAVIFGTWMLLLTMLPVYIIASGKVALVSSEQLERRVTPTQSRAAMRNRGSSKSTSSRDDSLQAEINRLFALNHSDQRAGFEQVVALSSLLPKVTAIAKIKTPTPEAFRSYIAPVGLPVVFEGMLEGTSMARWNWDYVKGKWGDHLFHNTRQGNYSTKVSKFGKHYVNRVSVRLSDFIDIVTGRRKPGANEEGLYITKQKIIPSEELEREFYYPPFYPAPQKKNCYLEPTAWYVVLLP